MAVVQTVLLFGSERRVLTPRLEKYPGVFNCWAMQRMAVMGPKRQRDKAWVYTPIEVELSMVSME